MSVKLKSITGACLLFFYFFIFGCGEIQDAANLDIDPNILPHEIIQGTLDANPNIIKASAILYGEAEDSYDKLDEFISSLYFGDGTEYIDLGKFSSYCVVSISAASASEIGMVKLENEADSDLVKNWIISHFARIAGNFSSYDALEETIAKNAEIRVSGKFIYYVACEDQYKARIFETMENIMTGK